MPKIYYDYDKQKWIGTWDNTIYIGSERVNDLKEICKELGLLIVYCQKEDA